MRREALAAVLEHLRQLNERLHLAAEEALELVADDAELVHLEQRRIGSTPLAVTPPMAADGLLALLYGMDLALDLEQRRAPSGWLLRPAAPGKPRSAPTGGPAGERPHGSH